MCVIMLWTYGWTGVIPSIDEVRVDTALSFCREPLRHLQNYRKDWYRVQREVVVGLTECGIPVRGSGRFAPATLGFARCAYVSDI
jgi:hypothetical protein